MKNIRDLDKIIVGKTLAQKHAYVVSVSYQNKREENHVYFLSIPSSQERSKRRGIMNKMSHLFHLNITLASYNRKWSRKLWANNHQQIKSWSYWCGARTEHLLYATVTKQPRTNLIAQDILLVIHTTKNWLNTESFVLSLNIQRERLELPVLFKISANLDMLSTPMVQLST